MGLKDRILGASDIREEKVTIPEWDNVEVLARGLTGKQRALVLQSDINPATGRPDMGKLYPDVIIIGALDPETKAPIFEPTDRDSLNEKNGLVLENLALVIMKLSGIEEKAVDDLKGNSESTQSAVSTSSSPSDSGAPSQNS